MWNVLIPTLAATLVVLGAIVAGALPFLEQQETSFWNAMNLRRPQGLSMSWNENETLTARITVFEAARDMLAGTLSYIEGARIIFFAWRGTKLNEQDADYTAMVAIHSETDALPFGEQRSYWNATALAGLQPEIDRKEAWAREFGVSHCHSLVDRFLSGQIETKPLPF